MNKMMNSLVKDVATDAVILRDYRFSSELDGVMGPAFQNKHIIWSERYAVGGMDILPTEQELQTYYAKEYRFKMQKIIGLEKYMDSLWHMATAESIIKWVINNKKVIDVRNWTDIGAGYGLLLHYASKHFPDAMLTALEPSKSAQADLHRVCHRVLNQPDQIFELANGPEVGTQDIISMIHVLEHVLRPIWYLQVAYNWLKPGGLFIIETPNDHRFEMMSQARKSDLPHVWFFSLDGLRNLVERSGFRIVRAAEIGFQRPPQQRSFMYRGLCWGVRTVFGQKYLLKVPEYYTEAKNRSAIRVLARKA